jgi:hypothetical protein
MKYTYVISEENQKVECIASFAGKPVRGIAKCNPEEEFDPEKGKMLAKLRCDFKLAKKRRAKAKKNYNTILKEYEALRSRLNNASEYVLDSLEEYSTTKKALAEYEDSLR